MGRKRRLELTKMKTPTGLPRWRKKHQGKIHYFRGAYDDALSQWYELRERLEADKPNRPEYDDAIQVRTRMAAWYLFARGQAQPPAYDG